MGEIKAEVHLGFKFQFQKLEMKHIDTLLKQVTREGFSDYSDCYFLTFSYHYLSAISLDSA
jgi:hypothetical protein